MPVHANKDKMTPHIPRSHRARRGGAHRAPTARPEPRQRGWIAATTALTVALGGLALAPQAQALVSGSSTGSNLVHNSGFESGTTGWRTRHAGQRLSTSTVHRFGSRSVRLWATRTMTTALNDRRNTVSSTTAGAQYRASAWVKATRVGQKGALRVREVHAGVEKKRTRKVFRLTDHAWHHVTMTVTVRGSGHALDVNVLAWNLRRGSSLRVDAVRLRKVTTTTSSGSGASQPCKASVTRRGIPSCGAFVGAAVGGNADPRPRESQLGGKLALHRTYWGGSNTASAVSTARTDLANHRLPWVSFKLPYSWADMANGRGDAWAKDLAAKLGALDGPVWVAFHHEPEGDGPIADWVRMQRHLSPIFRAKSNISFTIITTGWDTFFASNPAWRLSALLPDPSIVDIVGIDAYNEYGVTKSGSTSWKMTELKSYYAKVAPWAKAHGVHWAIAETGYTDLAAAKSPGWLSRAYRDMKTYGGVGFSYFDSALNPIGNSTWPLDPRAKLTTFRSVLSSSPRLR